MGDELINPNWETEIKSAEGHVYIQVEVDDTKGEGWSVDDF